MTQTSFIVELIFRYRLNKNYKIKYENYLVIHIRTKHELYQKQELLCVTTFFTISICLCFCKLWYIYVRITEQLKTRKITIKNTIALSNEQSIETKLLDFKICLPLIR